MKSDMGNGRWGAATSVKWGVVNVLNIDADIDSVCLCEGRNLGFISVGGELGHAL